MKKGYTKYEYIYIYSKLGVVTGTFAAVSISLSLFLGFVITLAAHAHPDLSSRICLLLFVLNLPVVLRNIKRYRAIQNKLQRKHSDDAAEMLPLISFFQPENSYGEGLSCSLSLLLQYCF